MLGPVSICSNVETSISKTCHVSGLWIRTWIGTSILFHGCSICLIRIIFSYYIYIQISADCGAVPACSCPRLQNCCGEWEAWDPVNWFNHTSWVAFVDPTDRPKSVRNRCLNEDFGGFFVLSCYFLDVSVGVGAFVIGLSKFTSFFLFIPKYNP